ncbi:APC family permease [Candidatus Babeliales bacterium]|nr:APC family permease [Candidatus Babeliales bacterium]
MKKNLKIDLFTSILININIIIGAGLFINPKPLTQLSGKFGFLNYIVAAIILLPIVLSIAKLAKSHPTAGGLYVYAKKYINNKAGFFCGWSYFLGKTTSAALLAHIFVNFFYKKIELLQNIPILILDIIFIFFLIFINIFGVKIGGKIQYFFTTAKIIPIIFVIFAGFSLFNPQFFITNTKETYEFFSALPIAIFAFLSFEIICSIGHMIKNPQKNIQRSIIYSFFIVVGCATIFQIAIFGSLGGALSKSSEPVKMLASNIFPNFLIIGGILNAFVFASIIGGSFGSLTSNCWNLFALANDNQLPFKKILTKTNKLNIPYASLIAQGIIACILLALTKDQIPLQNMTVFGMVTAYFLNSISAFIQSKKEKQKKYFLIIPALSIISSLYITSICFKNIFIYGVSLSFSSIFISGLLINLFFTIKKKI